MVTMGRDSFFNVADRRASSAMSKLSVANGHRNNLTLTPFLIPTHRNKNANNYAYTNNGVKIGDDGRKTGYFEDCAMFIRDISSNTLGAPELSKYESNVYRSRYLNTAECTSLVEVHCRHLSLKYYNRVNTLSASILHSGREGISFSHLGDVGIFSHEHMRSIAILSICARYHKIIYLSGKDDDLSYSGANICVYLLNLLRIIYHSVIIGTEGTINGNRVDNSRLFYSFLSRGIWSSGYDASENFGGMSSQSIQCVASLYCLCLHLFDVVISTDDEELEDLMAKEDEIYEVLSSISCCFVEDFMRNDFVLEDANLKTKFIPEIGTRSGLFSKHWSVINNLLAIGVSFTSRPLLIKCLKALCSKLEGSQRGRPLLVWAYCVYLKLCPMEISRRNHAITKSLFDEIARNKIVFQLKAVVKTLSVCLQDTKFSQYVQERINAQKVTTIFVINVCNLIQHKMDDLAVVVLSLFNIIIERYHKILLKLAKILSVPSTVKTGQIGDVIPAAVETLLNVSLFAKGPIQSAVCIVLQKLMSSSDITKSLTVVARKRFIKFLLSNVGLIDAGSSTVSTDDTGELMGKIVLLDTFIKTGALPEIIAELKGISAKELRSMVLRLGGSSVEYLYIALSVGDFPTRLVAYDSLLYNQSNSVDANTLLSCALSNVARMCPGITTLFSQYCHNYAKMTEYHAIGSFLSATKFLRALSSGNSLSDPCQNPRIAGLLFAHLTIGSLYDSSDPPRQRLIHSFLSPDNTTWTRQNNTEEKFRALLTSQRKELEMCQIQMDAQTQELKTKTLEYSQALQRLRSECDEKLEKSKVEITKMQRSIANSTSQVAELESRCEQMKTTNTMLQQENTRLSGEKNQMAEYLRETRNRNASLEGECSRLSVRVRELDESVSKMKLVQNENLRLTRELTEQGNNLEGIYRMLICLTSKYKNQMAILTQQKESLQRYKTQINNQKSHIEELENACQSKEHALNDLLNLKQSNETEIARLKDELFKKEDQLHSATKRLQELQNKANQLSQSLQKREEYCQHFKQQLLEKDRELAERKQQLNTIASACNAKPF